MRKTLFSSLLMAAAAMTAVSCSSDVEEFSDKNNGKEITFVAGNPNIASETRSYIDVNTLTPKWLKQDYVTILCHNNAGNVSVRSEEAGVYSTTAKFRVADGTAVANSQDFVAIHHGEGFVYDYESGVFSNLTIDNSQVITPYELDTKNDILISKIYTPQSEFGKNPFALEFLRVNAIVRLNLIDETGKLAGKEMSLMSISAPEEEEANNGLVGRFSFNANTCEIVKEKATVPFKFDKGYPKFYLGEENCFAYFHCIPTTLHKGNRLVFDIYGKSNEGSIRVMKEIVLPTDVLFESSKITTLNVRINQDDVNDAIRNN